jgi:hypothetical protein
VWRRDGDHDARPADLDPPDPVVDRNPEALRRIANQLGFQVR